MGDADRIPPLVLTPSQTVGPFFAYCLTPTAYRRDDLVTNDLTGAVPGPRMVIEGVVMDGRGAAVVDAMLEVWQADAHGRYAQAPQGAAFFGFGRAETDREGRFTITTIKPGPLAGPPGIVHAPHINVSVFAKGLQRQLFTRVYFAGERANDADPVLSRVPGDLVHTLIAMPVAGDPMHVRFDIRLRGDGETVFFEA